MPSSHIFSIPDRLLQSAFIVIMLALAMASTPAASQVESSAPGMSAAEAKALASTVLGRLGASIGTTEVLWVDDTPRDPAEVTPTSPIQVIVGDSRTSPVPSVYSNCVADSGLRTVRCDLRLLDDLIDGFAILRDESGRPAARERVLELVLSHEIGHVVLHHPAAGYHGTADGFSVAKFARYKTELAADAFAVGLLDKSNADRDGTYGLIVQLAYEAMKKSLCPETFPANCPCPGYTDAALCSRIALGPGLPLAGDERFRVTLQGTHPEFIVRFVRMLMLSKTTNAVDMYGPEARQVLLRVRVKDEHGHNQSTRPLFRQVDLR